MERDNIKGTDLWGSPQSIYQNHQLEHGYQPIPESIFEEALATRPTILYFHGNVGLSPLIPLIPCLIDLGGDEGDSPPSSDLQRILHRPRLVSVLRCTSNLSIMVSHPTATFLLSITEGLATRPAFHLRKVS